MNIAEVTNSNWALSKNNFGGIVQGYDDLAQCVGIILTTVQGSVPGRPDFGCGIYKLVDKSVSNVGNIIKLMADAIAKWENRVTVTKFVYDLKSDKGQYYARFYITWTTNLKQGSNVAYTVVQSNSDTKHIGFDYTFDFLLG